MALLKGINYPCKTQAEVDGLKTLNPAWFLTGDQTPNMATVAAGVASEFIPQRANAADAVTVTSLSPAPKALLTFNDPLNVAEANLLPIDALNAWSPMSRTYVGSPSTLLSLGSPTVALTSTTSDPGVLWAKRFVEACRAIDIKNADPNMPDPDDEFHVDFIACKIVGAPDATSFLAKLDALHTAFPNDKIWVTEAAVVDPNATTVKSTLYTRAQVEQFMKDLWPQLKTRTWLERFAWKTVSNTDNAAWFSSLFNSNGTRTSTGVVYAGLV